MTSGLELRSTAVSRRPKVVPLSALKVTVRSDLELFRAQPIEDWRSRLLAEETVQDARNAALLLAPHVILHPFESSRPCSVDWYLSRTRMRRHRTNWPDAEVLDVGEVTRDSLVSQTSGDEHSGRGRSRSDFFLEIAKRKKETRRGNLSGAECYVHIRPAPDDERLTDVQYWFFYAYNPFGPGHEGDWEHITLRLSRNLEIERVFFASHNKESRWFEPGQFDTTPNGGPIVYVARGSHACYPFVGTIDRGLLPSDETGKGRVWRTFPNVQIAAEHRQPTSGHEWLRYNGHWGEIGAPATSEWLVTSGPYGPAFQAWWDDDDRGSGPPFRPRRIVRCAQRDADGNIVALGGLGFLVDAKDVVRDIELGLKNYVSEGRSGSRALIKVIEDNGTKHLRSTADNTMDNNLDQLPKCPQ